MDKSLDFSEVLLTFLEVQQQSKIYHWQTSNGSKHQQSDQYHSKLSKLTDQLAEAYRGRFGPFSVESKNNEKKYIFVSDLNDDNFLIFLKSFRNTVANEIKKYFYPQESGFQTIFDDVIALTDQYLFLIALS